MPRIPLAELGAQLTTKGPGVELDIRSFGMEELAAAKSWETAGQMGEKLSEMGLKFNRSIEQVQRSNELSDAILTFRENLRVAKTAIKEDPDPNNWIESIKQSAQDNFEVIHKSLKNEVTKAHFKHIYSTVLPTYISGISKEADQRKLANAAGNTEANLHRSIELYTTAGSTLEKQQIEDEFLRSIADMQVQALISPEKAQQYIQKWKPMVQVRTLDQEMMADPLGTYKRLGEPEKYYPGVDLEIIRVKRIQTLGEVHRRQDDNELKVDQLFSQKQLTTEMLEQMRDTEEIRVPTYRLYDAALKSPKGMKDPAKYGELWIKADKGELREEEIYQNVLVGKIVPEEANNLKRTQNALDTAEMKFTKEPYFRLALMDIEQRLKLLDESKMEKMARDLGKGKVRKEPLPSHQAAWLLIEACQEAQRKGELTPKFIKEKAAEIMEPFLKMGARDFIKKGGRTEGGDNRPTGPGTAGRDARPTGPLFNPTTGPKGSQQVPWSNEIIPTRAKGGHVTEDQPYLVGEEGPEIFIPEAVEPPQVIGQQGPEVIKPTQSGEIIPNEEIIIPDLKESKEIKLSPKEEEKFQEWIRKTNWFKEFKKEHGVEPDLNDELYKYRNAWKAGVEPQRNEADNNRYHWSDMTPNGEMLKSLKHPTAWAEFFIKEYGINPDDLPANDPKIIAFKEVFQKKYPPRER